MAADASVELRSSQLLPDGSRYLPRSEDRLPAGQSSSPLPFSVASVPGGITLLASAPALAPGRYTLRTADGLFEFLVR